MNAISCIVLLLLFNFSYSQECVLKVEKDKFNGNKVCRTSFHVFDASLNDLYVSAMRSGNTVSILLSVQSKHSTICFQPGSKATVLFQDGTKSTIYHNDELTCDGGFYIETTYSAGKFGSNSVAMKNLFTKPIEAIRFFSTDGYVDVDLSKDHSGNSEIAQTCTEELKCLLTVF